MRVEHPAQVVAVRLQLGAVPQAQHARVVAQVAVQPQPPLRRRLGSLRLLCTCSTSRRTSQASSLARFDATLCHRDL